MMDNVFDIQKRTAELFAFHKTPAPQLQFDESAQHYQRRVIAAAQSLVPHTHPLARVNIGRVHVDSLDTFEDELVTRRVAAYKEPVGPLREVNETCPRTGRVVTKFYGSPASCWDQFAPPPRRASFAAGVGRGADSTFARMNSAAQAHESALGRAALAAPHWPRSEQQHDELFSRRGFSQQAPRARAPSGRWRVHGE